MPLRTEELDAQQIAIKETKVAGPMTVGDILEKVSQEYDFGDEKPENLHPLDRGLETIKYTFWTGKEPRLLKIYSQEASGGYRFRLRNQFSLERYLIEAGIPISQTVKTKSGRSYVVAERRATPNRSYAAAVSISEVFPGSVLKYPSLEDVRAISGYIARIHKIKPVGVVPALDSWSLLRLVETYDKDASAKDINLVPVLKTIGPTVEKLRGLDLDNEEKFPKALAHGDLHPFNILKGESGYCILDLGCMDYEQRLADLAIFMSMTCADFANPAKTKELFKAVVDTYEQQLKLTPSEKEALPLLIQANYAMFALRTAELLRDNPNDAEVRQFHERGIKGLEFMRGLTF